jgi:hypothetical protein
MHAKNHRQNKNFQILYFLAGSCHTPDGAYDLLCDLKENRESALSASKVAAIKSKASKIKAERLLQSNDEVEQLEGQAVLEEMQSSTELNDKLIAAAIDELNFINDCIDKVNPLRKFKHLPDKEAHEASQQEEWKYELIHRAENHLLTTGAIPAEQFSTMRLHPEFKEVLLPVIQTITALIHSEGGQQKLLEICAKKEFSLPLLLGHTDV